MTSRAKQWWGVHDYVDEGVERANEPHVTARCKVRCRPPAGEEGGCMVVHMQETDLTFVLLQNHDEGVCELVHLMNNLMIQFSTHPA